MPKIKDANNPTLSDGTVVVQLTPAELEDRQSELIDKLQAKEKLEAEKRESASDYRKKLRLVNERINILTGAIHTKSERRDAQQQMFRDPEGEKPAKAKRKGSNGKAATA